MATTENKLTNGGKPHVCGTIQVHNNSKESVYLCDKCDMAVDMPVQTTEKEESWEERFDKEFLSKEYDISDCSYEMHIKQIKSFFSHQQEELLKKIEAMKTVEVEEEHLNHSNKEIKKLAKRLDDAKRGYNKAIEEVLQVIKEQSNGTSN